MFSLLQYLGTFPMLSSFSKRMTNDYKIVFISSLSILGRILSEPVDLNASDLYTFLKLFFTLFLGGAGGRAKWDSIDYFSFLSAIHCVYFSLKQIIALRSLSLPLSSNVDLELTLLFVWSHGIIVLTWFHSWSLLI